MAHCVPYKHPNYHFFSLFDVLSMTTKEPHSAVTSKILLWIDALVFAMVISGLAIFPARDPSSVPSAADRPTLYQGN